MGRARQAAACAAADFPDRRRCCRGGRQLGFAPKWSGEGAIYKPHFQRCLGLPALVGQPGGKLVELVSSVNASLQALP